MTRSLQETYAPAAVCFGCGPSNSQGLRIRSFPASDGHVVCDFTRKVTAIGTGTFVAVKPGHPAYHRW
jgi:hypothetical protein